MGFGLARFPFVRDLTGFDFGSQPSIAIAFVTFVVLARVFRLVTPDELAVLRGALRRRGRRAAVPTEA